MKNHYLHNWAFPLVAASLVSALAWGAPVRGQSVVGKRPLVTQPVDERELVAMPGNTRQEVRFGTDLGAVADSLPLEHMYLQLNRTPEIQQAVDALVGQLHDPKSPVYHQWLSADQIAARFGPADEDVQATTAWLTSHGFKVNFVYRANGVIDFSGPASAVREAFHTEIHNLSVNGKSHIANMSDPRVPAALAPAVAGITSLHDFRPRPTLRPRPAYTFANSTGTFELIVPDDLYTFYDMKSLFGEGISGEGETIAVIEDSDAYTTDDWTAFRDTFGLTRRFPHGTLTQLHPQPSTNPGNGGPCADPGVNADGDDVETELDMEWASAAAPNAAIVVAACDNTATQFGGYIAMQNMITSGTPAPAIMSISYGNSEPQNGAAANVYTNRLYEAAVLEGISIFVSSDDNGAASSDYYGLPAESGINVNALGSTWHNVAVGGTDFGDHYLGETSAYWSAKNAAYYESALSYIPEIAWNRSCASSLLSNYYGYAVPYGINGFCNSAIGQGFLADDAGSGGPSGCAFGNPTIPSVVSGTCEGYRKPPYQQLVPGNPRDGVRDLPDVALLAAAGTWSHYFVWCYSDPNGGVYESPPAPCTGPPSGWAGGGGTSTATPIMAGLQALINQATQERQGNPNYTLYALGAMQFKSPDNKDCSATLGNRIDPRCVFHDVTLGDNDVPCLPDVINGLTVGIFNCFTAGGTVGVLSLSNTSYQPAYPATPGWDFATGLGSPDAYNLVRAWPGSRLH